VECGEWEEGIAESLEPEAGRVMLRLSKHGSVGSAGICAHLCFHLRAFVDSFEGRKETAR